MKIAKSVLRKIIARKDIIFNKHFRAPTIYCQVLIFFDKFYRIFFHQLQVRILKNIYSKNLIYRNCNRNSRSVNFPCECGFPLKKTYNKYELLRTSFSRILATDKETHINSMMMLLCIAQHLSNIWSSVYENVKQHWGWVKKKRCL